MKKILLSIFACVSIYTFAQQPVFRIVELVGGNPTVNDGATFYVSVSGGNVSQKSYSMTNLTASTLTLSVRKFEDLINTVSINDLADAYYCTGTTCYPSSTFNSTVSLAPNQSMLFYADLTEASVAGQSIVRYRFSNASVSQSVTLSIRYNDPTVGIKENNKAIKALSLYPNPCNGSATTVEFNSAASIGQTQLVVVNALGEIVSKTNTTILQGNNKIQINTESLQSGIYFIRIGNDNNALTKKLTITK